MRKCDYCDRPATALYCSGLSPRDVRVWFHVCREHRHLAEGQVVHEEASMGPKEEAWLKAKEERRASK